MTLESSTVVTIGIFILVHVIASVWWAARITTTLAFLQRGFIELLADVKATRDIYVTKEDYSKRLVIEDKEREAIWKRIDELKNSQGGLNGTR